MSDSFYHACGQRYKLPKSPRPWTKTALVFSMSKVEVGPNPPLSFFLSRLQNKPGEEIQQHRQVLLACTSLLVVLNPLCRACEPRYNLSKSPRPWTKPTLVFSRRGWKFTQVKPTLVFLQHYLLSIYTILLYHYTILLYSYIDLLYYYTVPLQFPRATCLSTF